MNELLGGLKRSGVALVTVAIGVVSVGCSSTGDRPARAGNEPEQAAAPDTDKGATPSKGVAGNGASPPLNSGKPMQIAVAPSGPEVADPDPRGKPAVAAAGGECGAPPPPPVRRGGNLTVESPPRASTNTLGTRMRSDIDGSLSARAARTWVGIDVPSFVQIASGTLELFLLDKVRVAADSAKEDGFLAFYRDPYDASSCGLSGRADDAGNCAFGAALYQCSGKLLWVLTLNPLMSRPDHLEVQDIRYDGGVLYFNEACQSYSREAGGKCSSLVALDPVAKKVLWRSAPLVSNNSFVVDGQYIISGYGFTAEPDFLYVLRRSDGKVMQRLSVSTAHEQMSIEPDGSIRVVLYDGNELRFAAQGFDGPSPKLVKTSSGKRVHAGPSRIGF